MILDRLRPWRGRHGMGREVNGRVWLVMGLGNPGPHYSGHRHNVGYQVTEELAHRWGLLWRSHKSGQAQVIEGRLGVGALAHEPRSEPRSEPRNQPRNQPRSGTGNPPDTRIVLGRARGYMNTSGGPTKALANFYRVPPEQTIVVHDELDLPFEAMRVKLGGGDNGHNGLKSIRSALGTGEFLRVRMGIGRPQGRKEVHNYVLSDFSVDERKHLSLVIEHAADAVLSLVEVGLELTQQRFNS
jgi:peptidyl-tRNA hydrolase, PTH1 family